MQSKIGVPGTGEKNNLFMDHLNIISRCTKIYWVELVVFYTDKRFINRSAIDHWLGIFSCVTVVTPDNYDPGELPSQAQHHFYNTDECKSEVWNRLAASAKKDWTLFLEDDEKIDMGYFPAEPLKNTATWIPALLLQKNGETNFKQFYQIRLVPKSNGEPVFGGKNLPDATRFMADHQVKLSDSPIRLTRDTDLFANTNPDEEMFERNFSPQLYLVSGNRLLNQRKYVYAAAQFRKLIKMDSLLPFDRLAAVNGLASCLAEQHKWPQALAMAEESITMEPLQHIPYLIQFRILELNKRWKDAFYILKTYHERMSVHSRANFDKFISEQDTILALGNLAQKAGLRQEALKYLEKFFAMQEGMADKKLLHSLLVLSIELEDCQKSVFYFEQMFKTDLPDRLSEENARRLNDYLSMFMVNGWYDYPSKIYDQLYKQESDNNEYRRRLIVTLSKTNRIEKARRLIAINL